MPVQSHKLKTDINKIIIAENNTEWQTKIISKIELGYKKSPFFKKNFDQFSKIINLKKKYLYEINIELIKWVMQEFNIKTKIILSSEIEAGGENSDKILNLCKNTGAKEYLSGISGSNYLNENEFKKNNITIKYQNFFHPIYNQLNYEFIPQISSIEALFMMGSDAHLLVKDDWPKKLSTLFK